MKARAALFLAFFVSTAGCERLWNAANRRGATKDAAALHLANGSAFDWFVLAIDPRTESTCLAFSYSYG